MSQLHQFFVACDTEEGLRGITDERVLAFRHELNLLALHAYVCVPIYLPIHLSFSLCVFIFVFVFMYICMYVLTEERVLAFRHGLASLDIYPSIHLSIYPSIYLYLSMYLRSISMNGGARAGIQARARVIRLYF